MSNVKLGEKKWEDTSFLGAQKSDDSGLDYTIDIKKPVYFWFLLTVSFLNTTIKFL